MTPICRAIQLLVCERYGITLDQLLGNQTGREFSRPRHVAMAAIRQVTGASYRALGGMFGRDHVTVRRAINAAGAWPNEAALLREIARRFNPEEVAVSDPSGMFRAWSVAHMDLVRRPTRDAADAARLHHAALVRATMSDAAAERECSWYCGQVEALLAQAAA